MDLYFRISGRDGDVDEDDLPFTRLFPFLFVPVLASILRSIADANAATVGLSNKIDSDIFTPKCSRTAPFRRDASSE